VYIDMNTLDQECTRLACLMAERGTDSLLLPSARTPQEDGQLLEEEFGAELAESFARIAAAGSEVECILPTLLMHMTSKLTCLATELSMRGDGDRGAVDIIRSIGAP